MKQKGAWISVNEADDKIHGKTKTFNKESNDLSQ